MTISRPLCLALFALSLLGNVFALSVAFGRAGPAEAPLTLAGTLKAELPATIRAELPAALLSARGRFAPALADLRSARRDLMQALGETPFDRPKAEAAARAVQERSRALQALYQSLLFDIAETADPP